MKKQAFSQIMQHNKASIPTDNEYYSDVALKLLLRSLTPVTVSPTFEQSVLQKVALLHPVNVYRNSITGLVMFATVAISFFTFSSMLNIELASFRSKNTIENTNLLPSTPIVVPEEVKQTSVQTVDSDLSQSVKTIEQKKKIYKRKSVKKTIQTVVPPPPKGSNE